MNQSSSATRSPKAANKPIQTHNIVKLATFLHFARGWTLVIGYLLLYYLSSHTGGIDPVSIALPVPLFIGILDVGMSFYLLNLGRGSWEYCTVVSGIASFFILWNLPSLFAAMAIVFEMVVFILLYCSLSLGEFIILIAPWNRHLFKMRPAAQ